MNREQKVPQKKKKGLNDAIIILFEGTQNLQ